MTTMVDERMLAKLRDWCAQRPVRICVCFGSQATGKARPDSDLDLAIWPLGRLPSEIKLHWWAEIEALLDHDISLVLVSADTDPTLGFEIARHGKLIYEREQGLWAHHRNQLWFIYQDHEPLRRLQREHLRQWAEEVRSVSRSTTT